MGDFANDNVVKWHGHKEEHNSTYNEVGVCEQCLAELNTFEEVLLADYSSRIYDEARDDALRLVASSLRQFGEEPVAYVQTMRQDFLEMEGRL